MFVYLLFLLTRAMSDGDTESIMVFTSIIWAVQHDINFQLILIMIAVHMINMASHQVSRSLDQLSESKIFQHCCDMTPTRYHICFIINCSNQLFKSLQGLPEVMIQIPSASFLISMILTEHNTQILLASLGMYNQDNNCFQQR